MTHPCPTCGHIHSGGDTVALDRFKGGRIRFAARYQGAPVRLTRDEAISDMCHHRTDEAERDPRDPMPGQETLL